MKNKEIIRILNEFQTAFCAALQKGQDGITLFTNESIVNPSEITCTFSAPFSTDTVEAINFTTECGYEFTEKFYNLLDEIYNQICQEKNIDTQQFENYEDLRNSKQFKKATIAITKARFKQVSMGISVYVKEFQDQGPYLVKIASFIYDENNKEDHEYPVYKKTITNIDNIKEALYEHFHCKEYALQSENEITPNN